MAKLQTSPRRDLTGNSTAVNPLLQCSDRAVQLSLEVTGDVHTAPPVTTSTANERGQYHEHVGALPQPGSHRKGWPGSPENLVALTNNRAP
jgi:hypothetical protein